MDLSERDFKGKNRGVVKAEVPNIFRGVIFWLKSDKNASPYFVLKCNR